MSYDTDLPDEPVGISAAVNSSPFDNNPEFYLQDNRQHRRFNPVTKNFLETKYQVLLPEKLIAGKSVLDLGSCLGAGGQWALFHGACHYTGVEVQDGYVQQSRQLLAHWGDKVDIVHQDVRGFLTGCAARQFDVVLVAGMLYHFIDTKHIIDEICRVADEVVVVETNYPPAMREGKIPLEIPITEYLMDQEVNLADQKASLLGISATSSLPALDMFFYLSGFAKKEAKLDFPITKDTVIYDETLLGDTQLQLRFAVRYFRSADDNKLKTLEDSLPALSGTKRSWFNDAYARQKTAEYEQHAATITHAEQGGWKFNADIAKQFSYIALREIPDYQRVIDKCVHIVKRLAKPDPKVIDIGSAIGTTLEALHMAGITNIYGVDNSQDMLDRSFNKATLIHANDFPLEHGPFDVVIANWVLHFVKEREQYLADIRTSLSRDGILILTEKVSSSEFSHELYYDIKRDNGVREAEIVKKRKQIEGVLATRDVSWYLNILHELGFKHVDIINSNTVFVTIMAQLEDHLV